MIYDLITFLLSPFITYGLLWIGSRKWSGS